MSRLAYYVPILGYHRVGEFKGDHVPTVSVEVFERQLEFLARLRYQVLGLEDVVKCLDEGRPAPRRATVITFDDGYEETHRCAWPMLKRFGFPATVFVTPGEVGLKGFATWQQVVEMAQDGMTIGSHTMHHSYIPLVPDERLAEELVESKKTIEARIGKPVHFISYPVGGYTPQAQAVVRQAGYLAACTTNRAASSRALDRYAIRRIKITERDRNLLAFRVKISGYYDLFRTLREPS